MKGKTGPFEEESLFNGDGRAELVGSADEIDGDELFLFAKKKVGGHSGDFDASGEVLPSFGLELLDEVCGDVSAFTLRALGRGSLVGGVQEVFAKERVGREFGRGDGGEKLNLMTGSRGGDIEDVGPLQKSAGSGGAVRIDGEGDEHNIALGSLKGMSGPCDELVVA